MIRAVELKMISNLKIEIRFEDLKMEQPDSHIVDLKMNDLFIMIYTV